MNNKKKVTVFLGIYNGIDYLGSLFNQIRDQDSLEFELLLVDNASTDNSYEVIQGWQQQLPTINVRVVRNSRNLGAGGSLNSNLHLIDTPWFTTFHQDDFYKSNHISELLYLINNAKEDISGVSVTMGSMSNEGKKII